MKWTPYSGAGNRFLIGDNRLQQFDPQKVIPLCAQAAVDGILLVEHSSCSDAMMRTFNSDGSEAEMCGNGLRCFIHFLNELGFHRSCYQIETLGGLQKGWLSQRGVVIQFAPPRQLKLNLPYDLHFLNTGVPHAVYFIDTVDNIAVNEIGRAIRFSPLFAPQGANINFVSAQSNGSLKVRTYERGVERETLACGTGAVASALIAHKVLNLSSPISVQVRSGEVLTVSFADDWSEILLEGPVLVLKEQMPIMVPA